MPKSNTQIPFELSDYVIGKTFREAGERQAWLNDEKVIAAVSGGGDSLALLMMAAKFFGGTVTALHVNHGIRGTEADGDETFTHLFAEKLGVPFLSVKLSVPSSREKGESLELTARRLRRKALLDAAKYLDVKTILLGHNRDDLAETVLFNLLRGTGIRGAVGITETTEVDGVRFCRPLLGFTRKTLRGILKVRGLAWREDSSNADDTFTRNYIRNQLMPEIQRHVNSQAAEHLAQFGEDIRAVRENEDKRSSELFAQASIDENSFSWRKLRTFSADDAALVVREAGRRRGLKTLSRKRCGLLAELIIRGAGFTFQWERGATITGKGGRITINDDRGTHTAG